MPFNRQTGNPVVNKLAERRLAAGMTQWDLASASGVSRETISKTETGISVPNVDIALHLARALRVRVEDLFQLASSGAADAQGSETVRTRAQQQAKTSAQLDRIEHMLTKLLNQLEE